MQQSFESTVEEITRRHPEYSKEAYTFMRESLDAAMEHFSKTKENPHLSAQELYMGACDHAIELFGPLAPEVLEHWGVRSSDDIGSIVYNMIEAGVFGKSQDDSQEQFHALPPLRKVLDAPYALPEDEDADDAEDENEAEDEARDLPPAHS